ncbi:NAD(P)H-dependent oxidoreductase [Arthrobacter sp. NQ7]|uniref:NADPH-dependent FMN reductase n=1 Tax=Arthrobacter sp. NQ7 TaxID=3032303 RepID=UPI00241002DC|nr:NAD(P)H-dependent oxidoreductase [Arthrobacter sp. NQ7]MDJ0457980.1 NAD(P)H-dependent oxidoreductase [Arthrobacter sp. NQ7]
MMKAKIGIIAGSTRPGRAGRAVADWVYQQASECAGDAAFELIDVADYGLPLLDEPLPPSLGQYSNEHTKTWAEAITAFDGYIFVTGEYNHSVPGALKNAIDFLYSEWNNKSAGFVSYGSAGGIRAVEHLRLIAADLQMADVRAQVALPLASEFTNYTDFAPTEQATQALGPLLDQVEAWARALKTLRTKPGA